MRCVAGTCVDLGATLGRHGRGGGGGQAEQGLQVGQVAREAPLVVLVRQGRGRPPIDFGRALQGDRSGGDDCVRRMCSTGCVLLAPWGPWVGPLTARSKRSFVGDIGTTSDGASMSMVRQASLIAEYEPEIRCPDSTGTLLAGKTNNEQHHTFILARPPAQVAPPCWAAAAAPPPPPPPFSGVNSAPQVAQLCMRAQKTERQTLHTYAMSTRRRWQKQDARKSTAPTVGSRSDARQ